MAPRLGQEVTLDRHSFMQQSSFTNQNWGFVLLALPVVMVVMWIADKLPF
jgi:hypothetical protein